MNAWIVGVAGIFGIVALVGVIVAYFRVNLSQATIDTLKESNAALTARNGELDSELLDIKARVGALERENESLRSALDGKADVERIAVLVEHHHEDVMADRRMFQDRFTAAMVEMGDKLDANRSAVADVKALVGGHRTGDTR